MNRRSSFLIYKFAKLGFQYNAEFHAGAALRYQLSLKSNLHAPSTMDWRLKGVVSTQVPYEEGSWAYSDVAAVESAVSDSQWKS